MIRIHVIQARFGDCFLLEYGEEANPSFMLVDGGPSRNYEQQLKPALTALLKDHTHIDDVVISHVDNDHIVGVLDFLTELQQQKDKGGKPYLSIGQVWFNSFSKTIGNADIQERMTKVNKVAAVNGLKMQEMSMALNGIKEGGRVLQRTTNLCIDVNKDAPNGFFLASKDNKPISRPNIDITVIGPTAVNLDKLRIEWEEWIKKNEQHIAAGKYTKDVAAALDRSVPNLSSIVMLIKADGKTILLTGDCRSDHLQQGLIETGLSADGRYHVDVLKVPHHGSRRNTRKSFFEEVTADAYIISADGTYDNPDEETLDWIVAAAQTAGRKVKLIFTNETASTTALLQKYSPGSYDIQFLGKNENYMTYTLAPAL